MTMTVILSLTAAVALLLPLYLSPLRRSGVVGSALSRRGVGGALFVVVGLLAPAVAHAGDFPVANANDAGAGSLRQAIIDANGHAGPDAVSINVPSPPNTVHLLSALPAINDNVTITGPGQGQFIVSGEDAVQPFKVNNGKTVSISGLTVSHGKCDSAACDFTGGAIWNNGGTLTLTGVTVNHSTTTGEGGGITNSGTMTIQNSTVSANTASTTGGTNGFPEGGGIFNQGTMNIVRTTVTGNSASATGATADNFPIGGGIFNSGAGELTIDQSTISSNDATADAMGGNDARVLGGAINNRHNLTIIRSTVSGNTASATGGSAGNEAGSAGISNINPASPANVTVTLDRTTLADNAAVATGTNASSQAGGMALFPGTYTFKSSTIAHNSADFGANLTLGGAPVFKNTIVSDPAGGGTNCTGIPPGLTSSYSLSSDPTCGFTDPTDQPNTNPMIAASLASNGGPTRTYALQPGSPAIDQGKASIGETVDQRGEKRPSDFGTIPNAAGGDGSDVGAFELQDTTPPNTIIDSGPAGVTNDPTPRFAFHSTEAGSTLQCKLDAGAFVACASPRTTGHLLDGTHTFQVRAKDAAGNLDPTPASRSFTVKTAEVKRSGSTLVITAAPGAKDNLQITRPSATTVRVTDSPGGAYTGSGIHTVPGSGCSRSGDYTANCSASGIGLIQVASGGQTDKVTNATALASSLNGGAANDVITGGSVHDTITGGPGVDTMTGRNGSDLLRARDLTSDAVINCDGGTKPGPADRADLDLLPNDPSSVVVGCETKTRH